MWKKILNFLIIGFVIISLKSNMVFAEKTHISTGMSTKITRKLRTMISLNLSEEVQHSITLLLEKLRPHKETNLNVVKSSSTFLFNGQRKCFSI